MASVLYVLSSLPYVDLAASGDGMFDNFDDFIEQCQVLEEAQAIAAVEAITTPRLSNLPIAKKWAQYDYSIRLALAERRSQRIHGKSIATVLVHDEVPVTAEAYDVLNIVQQEDNPYIREKKIIEKKWQILDILEATYQFCLENIIIYGWKLQLYYLYCNLTEEKGRTQWNNLLASLSEKSGFEISAITGGING